MAFLSVTLVDARLEYHLYGLLSLGGGRDSEALAVFRHGPSSDIDLFHLQGLHDLLVTDRARGSFGCDNRFDSLFHRR